MIDFTVNLETVTSDSWTINLFNDKKEISSKESTDDGFEIVQIETPTFTEHLLYLEAHHDLGDKISKQQAEFIVVVDRSGSMHGGPWKQVQAALIQMLNITRDNSKCRVISYNQEAKKVELTGCHNKDRATINKIRASGSTNFVSVFEEIGKIFEDKKEDSSKSYVIFLMTDGLDTCNNPREMMVAKELLQAKIEKFGAEVVFNVLGFSADHDDEFLESLTVLGTSDGSYSYVSTSEGDKALEERLVEMVESASSIVGRNLNIAVVSQNMEFLGDWFGESDKDVVLPAMLTTKNGLTKIQTKKFVRIKNGEEPNISINVYNTLTENAQPIDAKITKVNQIVLSNKDDIDGHNLRKLRTAINMITGKISANVGAGETNKKEMNDWYELVKEKMEKLNIDKTEGSTGRLSKNISTGLDIVQMAMDPERVKEKERVMSERGMCQMYRTRIGYLQQDSNYRDKSKTSSVKAGQFSRSSLQKKARMTDYTVHSDDSE
jgi:uncharacterized protein YegL